MLKVYLLGGLMNQISNIYKDVYNIDNLRRVYGEVRRACNNVKGIYAYDSFESTNLYIITDLLRKQSYKFSKYHIFMIKEPKYRLIMSENIPDKIVNHVISRYLLLPALDYKLIDTNVATRFKKGSGYAYDMLSKYLRKLKFTGQNIYALKIDIKKYFYNIDHNILKAKLKNEISDVDALELIFASLDTTNEVYVNKEIMRVKNNEIKRVKKLKITDKEKERKINDIMKIPIYELNKGLGIGNMTSQILAVYYLNDVDHYIKEVLECKYYIRYMDDLVILDNDKEKLKEIKPLIKERINMLNLEVNNKSRIIDFKRGFSFLGYTYILKDKLIIKINNQTMRRIKRHLSCVKKRSKNKYMLSLASYKGYFQRADYAPQEYIY